jgi:TrmH RNA methyltransferase
MANRTNPRRQGRRIETQKLLRVAGLPAVAALFATAPDRVEQLFFADDIKSSVGTFCATLARARKPYRLVEPEELERISGSVLHGGVVALAQPRRIPEFDAGHAAAWARDNRLLLLLDGIGNPHNLGAIVRTAAFFGLPRIVLSDRPEQALPSAASYRVAEGGFEYVDLYRGTRFVQVLATLRHSHWVIGAAAEGGRPIETLPRSERPLALVMGNEEDGLRPATLKACEELVTIPGSGSVQSLNVSASAAILIYAGLHSSRT